MSVPENYGNINMTNEVATVSVSLYDAADTKTKMNEVREQIRIKEEEAGIPALRETLSELENTYKRQIAEAVEAGVFEQDHLQLINKGRVMTVVTPKALFERFPDLFWKACKVGKGATEDLLLWLYQDQGQSLPAAKKSVQQTIEEISTKSQSGSNYELVDLLNGE